MLIRVPQGTSTRIIELEPALREVERGESESTADITLLLSKKNRVAIQDPTVQEHRDAIDPSVLSALRLKWTNPKFLALATTVTCMPDPGCRFTFLRIEYDLWTRSIS